MINIKSLSDSFVDTLVIFNISLLFYNINIFIIYV